MPRIGSSDDSLSLLPDDEDLETAPLHYLRSAPGEIRTPSLLIRSQVLYPIELRARDRPWRVGFIPGPRPRTRRVEKAPRGALDAQERIRTSTTLRPPAPQAGASANSATWAGMLGGGVEPPRDITPTGS